jgi:hypothetical protein
MRILWVALLVMSLSACELLDKSYDAMATPEAPDGTYLCDTSEGLQSFEEFCQLRTWTEFLLDANQAKWVERHDSVKNLGDETKQKLQKILLSQAIDTPYSNRLRAQNWLDEILPLMDEKMQQVAMLLVQKPSQQMLELESAITILSRVNARQEKTIKDLQETLNIRSEEIKKQREQVEQLLKIETNMSDERRSNQS